MIAALADVRSEADRARTEDAARSLGVPIEVVALASGTVRWPADFPSRAAALVAGATDPEFPVRTPADVVRIADPWPGARP